MKNSIRLGIDIGGSGIKGALVDINKGVLVSERERFKTPQPATPESMSQTFLKLTKHFGWEKPIGCGFPSAVQQGVARTASNIDNSWIGTNIEKLFSSVTGLKVKVLNDADAAAVAEMKFGAGKNATGSTLLLTIGTGIGSAFFINGNLLPNTELGHLYLKGQHEIAERKAANSAREKEELSWEEWAKRFDEYLHHVYGLFYPDLVIIGGGQSKKFHKFQQYLTVPTRIIPAELKNEAGIIGAALATPDFD